MYYSTALNHPVAQLCPDLEYAAAGAIDDHRIPLDTSSPDEVLTAIKELNNGCSPGSDGVTAKLLKHSASTSDELLLKLFHCLEMQEGSWRVAGWHNCLSVIIVSV